MSSTFTTSERIDIKNLELLLNSFKLRQWDSKQKYVEDRTKQHLILPNLNLLKDIIENDRVKITYTLDNYGRYKNSNGIKGYSYTNMFSIVRNLLSSKYYDDIDIVNCHPVIIYNLCLIYNKTTKKRIPVTALKKFIDERERILKEIVDNNPGGHMNEERIEGVCMNRNVAKRFCLTLFFGASLENMKDNFNTDP